MRFYSAYTGVTVRCECSCPTHRVFCRVGAMTGQKGKWGADDIKAGGLVQRRGSMYALMQKHMLHSEESILPPSAAAAASGPQLGKRVSTMAVSGVEAARGKDVDLFGLKKNRVISSSSDDDDDDDDDGDDGDDDDNDDNDGPEKPWRYASFASQGEPLSAVANENIMLPTPEDHGEFVTLAVPLCTKPIAKEVTSGEFKQLTQMKV